MSFNIPLSTLPLKLTKNREVGEGDNTIVTPLGRSQWELSKVVMLSSHFDVVGHMFVS